MVRVLTHHRLLSLIVMISLTGLSATAAPAATSPTLGAVESYSVLAGSIVTNTGATTMPGNMGISPSIGTPPHYTGFPPGAVGPPGTIHDADANAADAQAADTAAFGALDQGCDTSYAGVQDLTLVSPLGPGVYCADAFILSGNLTLSGSGVWIFKSASTLTTSSNSSVTGGDPCSVWWRLVSSGVIGTGTSFIGNILALTSISLGTGASLNGRALAQTGAVTMDNNSIFGPNCSPTAVQLLDFQADQLSGLQTRLQWTTALEVDNFGFNLYRANVGNIGQASLIHFEPATTQGGGSGATYFYTDTVPSVGTWWYWLADVDTQAHETIHAPISVTVQFNNRTYMPFVVSSVY